MKSSFLIIVMIGSLAVLCCRDIGTAPPTAFFQDDVKEAVFRHQFYKNDSGLQQGAKVYFIGLYVPGDSTRQGYYVDLSDGFMSRFQGNSPPVKKASECTPSMNGVFDKQTGNRGLLFRIESMREFSNDEVEVEGGYFEAGLSASGNLYTVRRIDGRCVVVKDVLIWIS
jgi:hypothetical protein